MIYVKIKDILQEKGKSKYWFIKNMQGEYTALSRLMNNETVSIHFDTLEKICDILDCEVSDIIVITKDNK